MPSLSRLERTCRAVVVSVSRWLMTAAPASSTSPCVSTRQRQSAKKRRGTRAEEKRRTPCLRSRLRRAASALCTSAAMRASSCSYSPRHFLLFGKRGVSDMKAACRKSEWPQGPSLHRISSIREQTHILASSALVTSLHSASYCSLSFSPLLSRASLCLSSFAAFFSSFSAISAWSLLYGCAGVGQRGRS